MSLRRLAVALLAMGCAVSTGCSDSKNSPAKVESKTAKAGDATAEHTHAEAAGTAAAYGAEDEPFDPVAVNGPIFEGWPTPQVALVFTGEQDGYFEPCGCAGPNQQKGGVSRRHTFLRELEAKGWPLAAFDLGGLVRRYGLQTEIKFGITVEAMKQMGYQAVGFGLEDLRLPASTLIGTAAQFETEGRGFVAANVALFAFDDAGPVKRFRVFEVGGRRIGVTAVFGDSLRHEVHNDDLVILPAAEALAEVTPKLAAESGIQVLLCHGKVADAEQLARDFPEYEVVVTAGGADEPPYEIMYVQGTKTPLVEVGHKGKYAVVLGLYADQAAPMRYQRVPLDSRFADSPEMTALMSGYQDELQALGLEGLEIRPLTHPRASAGGEQFGHFVGAAKCGACHTQAYAKWITTKHSHATETLTKANPPRQFDPECLSCHSTGWNPQEYFPYETGFASLETTPAMTGNGCENCHGPGAAHVAAEAGRDLGLREQMRQSLRLTQATAEEKVCRNCHDLDNSPLFDFAKYWLQVEHKGKK